MTRDEVAIVAIYADIGDAVVNGCRAVAGVIVHVALRGPAELLGAVEMGNVTHAVQVVQFGGCGSTVCSWLVAFLLLLFTVEDDGFWNIGRRGVFTMLAQLSLIAGISRRGRQHRHRGAKSGKLGWKKHVLCGRDDLVSTVISVGELPRSVSWPSELTPAHVLRSPAPLEARAEADMR